MPRFLPFFFFLLLPSFYSVAQPAPAVQATETPAAGKPDTGRIGLLLQLGNGDLNRPWPLKNNPDSALLFFGKALELSRSLNSPQWENRVLAAIGTAYMKAGDMARAKTSFFTIIEHYRKTGDKAQEGLAWLQLGQQIPLLPKENLSDKLQSLENAHSLFIQTHQRIEELDAFRGIAEVHLNQEKLDLAEKELQQVLDAYKAAGYKMLHYTYDLLAEVYKLKVDLHNELKYRIEGVKTVEATADTANTASYYSKLALVYADLDMYALSDTWIYKAMENLKGRKMFEEYYGDLSLYIYDLIKENKAEEAIAFLNRTVKEVPPFDLAQRVDLNEMFGNCYAAMKSNAKAEQYYMEMMRDYRITNFNKDFYRNNAWMITDYIHYNQVLATFYLGMDQFAKAGPYVTNVLSLPAGTIRPITLYKFYQMQFQVDSAAGNYISAIRNFQLHKRLNDSLFNATKSQQIADLQIKYEIAKKEQSYQLLEARAKSEHAELQNVSLQRNITIGGVAMLLIIAGLAYNGYRNKQRSNREMQIKQTEINQQNKSLQSLLQEKEWLLREVHHRVKNNLQIIISLLNAQSDFLDNPSAIHAIQESRERMQAIALIHQKLYQPDHGPKINMYSYIQDLVSYLESSFTVSRGIFFQLHIDDISLDVSQAVPLGLILNEAITNAVKYAFPKDRAGVIEVTLRRQGSRSILLKIADNGVGLPSTVNLGKSNSLGMQLIRLFAEQLEGELGFSGEKGVEISLLFKQEFAVTVHHAMA